MKRNIVIFILLAFSFFSSFMFISCAGAGTSESGEEAETLGFSIKVARNLSGGVGTDASIYARGLTVLSGKTVTVWTSYDASQSASIVLDSSGSGTGSLELDSGCVGQTITVFAIVSGIEHGGTVGGGTYLGQSDSVSVSEDGASGVITMRHMLFKNPISGNTYTAKYSDSPQDALPSNAGGSFEWKVYAYPESSPGVSADAAHLLNPSAIVTNEPTFTISNAETCIGDISRYEEYLSDGKLRVAVKCYATFQGITTQANSYEPFIFTGM
ncbi:MAG: hypothetical protein K6G00_07735 [Treponema sp.]|nr:hypothetical protein [Treponema sp.]